MKKLLGKTADNFEVMLDDDNTHVAYHLLETPDLLDLVIEIFPTIETLGQNQVVNERNMRRVVGTTNLVMTTDEDEIIYAKRKGRDTYSRFVKNRKLTPTQYIVVVLRRLQGRYLLWTAMCGRLLPSDAYKENSDWSKTHAMVFDDRLVQGDAIRTGDNS